MDTRHLARSRTAQLLVAALSLSALQAWAQNNPPVANADRVTAFTAQPVQIPVLENDSDPDGDVIRVVRIRTPANGTATFDRNSVTYTPGPGFTGRDTFAYVIRDANGAVASALIIANVTAPLNSATLQWSAPSTRENGTPLAPGDLAGYEIYVLGENSGHSAVIPVNDPMATSYTVTGLESDVYHFSIAAMDTSGKFSSLSQVVTKSITE